MSSAHLVGLLEILQSARVEVCQGCERVARQLEAVCDHCYATLCGNLPCALDPPPGMEEWARNELAFVCAPCFVRYREDNLRRLPGHGGLFDPVEYWKKNKPTSPFGHLTGASSSAS